MRGALQDILKNSVAVRIIPADAGSTPANGIRERMAEDHPRGCGEHKLLTVFSSSDVGSSPRMRGARAGKSQAIASSRIIPADAGSTILYWADGTTARDHPRGCGEHCSPVLSVMSTRGSSPRMRGAHPQAAAREAARGIIPADAGSTEFHRQNTTMSEDHPRGCGEHRYLLLSKYPL